MSCPSIASGDRFLGSTLAYLDCAGQQLGEAGYQAMSAPGSIVGQVLLACLTLFIAFQGLRLMFGQRLGMGDAAMAAVKIGLVLMLAGSWPAVRTLFHDTAVRGPSELVAQIGGNPSSMAQQLQSVDSGIVALTKWGTGKLDIRAGRTADGSPAASEFAGEATNESLGLSMGRLFYLVGAIAALGFPRLVGGLLVSMLPLFAGLLLFDRARGLTIGWVRAWLFVVLASFAGSLLLAIESAMLQPWLVRVIGERAANLATPSAPAELLAMTLAFAVILTGSLMLLARICFAIDPAISLSWLSEGGRRWSDSSQGQGQARPQPAAATDLSAPSRASRIGAAFATGDRLYPAPRVSGGGSYNGSASFDRADAPSSSSGRGSTRPRRAAQRASRSIRKRDRR